MGELVDFFFDELEGFGVFVADVFEAVFEEIVFGLRVVFDEKAWGASIIVVGVD